MGVTALLRKPFDLEPQRDASKQAWEVNASMWYAFGVRRPDFGVLLRYQAQISAT